MTNYVPSWFHVIHMQHLFIKMAVKTQEIHKPGIRLLKATVRWPIKSRPIGSWSQTRKRTKAISAMWSVKDKVSSHTGLKPGESAYSIIRNYFISIWHTDPIIVLSSQLSSTTRPRGGFSLHPVGCPHLWRHVKCDTSKPLCTASFMPLIN